MRSGVCRSADHDAADQRQRRAAPQIAIECHESGLTLLGLEGHCIGNGTLTVENPEQAFVRADPNGQNKGGGAAAAALHLIALDRSWKSRPAHEAAPDRDIITLAGKIEGPGQA